MPSTGPKRRPAATVNAVRGKGNTVTTTWAASGRWSSMALYLDVTVVTGTNPTLNLYVQNLLPDATSADDLVSFTQKTSTGSERVYFVEAGNVIGNKADATTTAGTVIGGLLGDQIRLKWVIGGTSTPTFTFAVYGSFRY